MNDKKFSANPLMNFKNLPAGMKILLIAITIGLSGAAFVITMAISDKTVPRTAHVCFSGICVKAEMAATPAMRERGLMFREILEEKEGMLFLFPSEGLYSFWMKNTPLPLDMIWIDNARQVVQIKLADPCLRDDCPSYESKTAARYVLEVNRGFAEKNNIKIGDTVKIEY